MRAWLSSVINGFRTPRAVHVTGHLAEEPQIEHHQETRVMAFRLVEYPDRVFRLRMYPTTPMRHRGDHVDVQYVPSAHQTEVTDADAVFMASDDGMPRLRRKRYLATLRRQDGPKPRQRAKQKRA